MTMSTMTSTPSAMRPAAITPATREARVTPRMKASIPSPIRPAENPPAARTLLFDRQRFFDQLLAVGHILGELGVCAFLRHCDPCVVVGVAQRHDLDLVILERLDGVGVH